MNKRRRFKAKRRRANNRLPFLRVNMLDYCRAMGLPCAIGDKVTLRCGKDVYRGVVVG